MHFLESRGRAQSLDSKCEASEFGIINLTFAKRVEFDDSQNKRKKRWISEEIGMLINLIVVTISQLCIYEIIMLYTLNICNFIFQFYLNKAGKARIQDISSKSPGSYLPQNPQTKSRRSRSRWFINRMRVNHHQEQAGDSDTCGQRNISHSQIKHL